jgi:hypothetical protein
VDGSLSYISNQAWLLAEATLTHPLRQFSEWLANQAPRRTINLAPLAPGHKPHYHIFSRFRPNGRLLRKIEELFKETHNEFRPRKRPSSIIACLL